MRVVRLRPGRVLEVLEEQEPPVGPGELLVGVSVVGVSRPALAAVPDDGSTGPGGDVVGWVRAVGEGVTGWERGDRVAGIAFSDAYADLAVLTAPFAWPVPPGIGDAAAAAVIRNGHVALGVLRAAGTGADDDVLVTAAAGGVGHLLVQAARHLTGGRVVAAVGSPAKLPAPTEWGADTTTLYDGPIEDVDIVLDGVGGTVLPSAMQSLRVFGRAVTYAAAPATIDAGTLRSRSQTLTGFSMAHLVQRRPDRYRADRAQLWEMLADGRLRPQTRTLPLERAAEAHRLIDARENVGKLCLTPLHR